MGGGNPQYPIRPGQKSADTISRTTAAQRAKILQRAANPGGGAGATNQRKQAAKGKWTAEEQRQREEAGRKSAAKRRKGGGAGAAKGPKASPEAQATLKALGQQIEQFKKLYRTMVGMGLKPEDIAKGKGGAISGKTPEAHEKLLRAMKKLGMDFDVQKDGSGQFVNPLTDKVTTIGPAPKGKVKAEWTQDGKRMEEAPVEAPKPTVRVAVGSKTLS